MPDLPYHPYRPRVSSTRISDLEMKGELSREKALQLTEHIADLQGISSLAQNGTVEEKLDFVLATIAAIATTDAHTFLVENDMLHMESFLKDPHI